MTEDAKRKLRKMAQWKFDCIESAINAGDIGAVAAEFCSSIAATEEEVLALENYEANAYERNGYDTRTDYLHALAEDYCVDYSTVRVLADTLGPDEDFDGLVAQIQDMCL